MRKLAIILAKQILNFRLPGFSDLVCGVAEDGGDLASLAIRVDKGVVFHTILALPSDGETGNRSGIDGVGTTSREIAPHPDEPEGDLS
jgi:hypothetical protein